MPEAVRVQVFENVARKLGQKVLRQRLALAGEILVSRVKENLSQPSSHGETPSKPGEFPHADTGYLRNSIFWKFVGDLQVIVGCSAIHGVYLEFGTTGVTIVPKIAKALSWIDPQTGERRFAKSVKIPPMEPRPFLRATLYQMEPELQRRLGVKAA